MGYRLNKEIISRIRDGNNIVDIVSGYLTLKKTGRNYKACCPFHSEKTPSFIVTPDKGIFHCFGCGAGGDVISFLMRMDNLSFPEAAALLAKNAGVQVEFTRENEAETQLKARLLQLNYQAAVFFQRALLKAGEAEAARVYLQKRKLNNNTIEQFMLGFAPGGHAVQKFLQSEGFGQEEIESAGLKFFQRVMFPIFNLSGECVGFGGRSMGRAEPKYLNTAETPVFSKGNMLYGLNLSRQAVQRAGELVLVEGYLDLIKVFQSGLQNIAAGLGTALTQAQARLIRRFTDRVVLLYDGDDAGRAAALRNIEVLLNQDFQVAVVLLPAGEDPDSFVDKHGPEALAELLQQRANPFLFRLDMVGKGRNLDLREEKIGVAREMLSFLLSVPNQLRCSEYLSLLADRLKLNEENLRLEFQRMQKKSAGIAGRTAGPAAGAGLLLQSSRGIVAAEKQLLALIYVRPEFRSRVAELLTAEDFTESKHRTIFGILIAYPEAEADIRDRIGDDPDMLAYFAQFEYEPENGREPEQDFHDILQRLMNNRRETSQTRPLLEQKIKTSTEPDLEDMRAFQELVKKRHQKEAQVK